MQSNERKSSSYSQLTSDLSLPKSCRTWQYNKAWSGGIDNALQLNSSASLPTPSQSQHIVRVIATALNPVDYKPAEHSIFARMLIPKDATPGIDFSGVIIEPAPGSALKQGQLVYGCTKKTPFAAGALSEYTAAEADSTIPIPAGLDPIDAATIGVAGLTAYQCIHPRVKPGNHVFINGGSGGTGVFGIQIAKALGCAVTTSCSTANVELCKSLGADHVIDYKQGSVIDGLNATGTKFDLVVDNVGSDLNLYYRAHEYTVSSAVYVMAAGAPSLQWMLNMTWLKTKPAMLGGGQRKFESMFAQGIKSQLELIGEWMAQGKVTAVIDQTFSFEEAPQAFTKLKTGRARGKIVVDVVGSKKA